MYFQVSKRNHAVGMISDYAPSPLHSKATAEDGSALLEEVAPTPSSEYMFTALLESGLIPTASSSPSFLLRVPTSSCNKSEGIHLPPGLQGIRSSLSGKTELRHR